MKNIFYFFLILIPLLTFSQEEKKETNIIIEIELYKEKISSLEKQIKENEEQISTYKNKIEIIEKVEGFYNRSWEKLIWFLGIMGAIIGTFIGFIIPKEQKKIFNNELEKQKQEFNNQLEKYNQKLISQKEDFEKYSEEKRKNNESKLRDYFQKQNEKISQQFAKEIIDINEKMSQEISILKYNNLLSIVAIHKTQKNYPQTIYWLGKVLNSLLGMKNINFNEIDLVVKYLEKTIDIISDKDSFNLSKTQKETTLKILGSLISMKLDSIPEERIQKIIDFIREH